MLWVKLIHIVMIIAWMAGIFYLPRIFVHYVEAVECNQGTERIKIMGQKLYKFMGVMAFFAIVSGLVLWLYYKIGFAGHWMHAKLSVVAGFLIYHHVCGRLLKKMKKDELKMSSKALRWFNELPLVLLVVLIYFVIFKPF